MTPFRHLLHDHRLWGIRRKTVVPAFSMGLGIAFAPIPGHPIYAALLALLLRINVPVAVVATFLSNPLTMGPMYYLSYRVGSALLGIEPQPFDFELSFDWLRSAFMTIGLPLTLGCLILGSITALVGYVVLDAIWRYHLFDYKSRKRKGRSIE